MNKDVVGRYFTLLRTVMKDPANIFNMDETGCS